MKRKTAFSQGRFLSYLAMACMAALLTACDPGTSMIPQGWTVLDESWSTKEFGTLDLKISQLHELAGNSRASFTLSVENHDTVDATLTKATLKAEGGDYDHTVVPNVPWKAVAAAGHGDFMMDFDFGQGHTLTEILKDHFSLQLQLQVGTQTRDLVVEYVEQPR